MTQAKVTPGMAGYKFHWQATFASSGLGGQANGQVAPAIVVAVGMAMSIYANERQGDRVWVAQATLAEGLGFSERQVRRAVAWLRDAGWIIKLEDAIPEAGRGAHYRLALPTAASQVAGVPDRDASATAASQVAGVPPTTAASTGVTAASSEGTAASQVAGKQSLKNNHSNSHSDTARLIRPSEVDPTIEDASRDVPSARDLAWAVAKSEKAAADAAS